MRKTIDVFTQELFVTFRRPSYLFFAFGLPVLAVLVLGTVKFFQNREAVQETADIQSAQPEGELVVEGYVDQSGLIRTIPDDLPPDSLVAYADESAAQAALEAQEISAYYLIPADYVARGEYFYVYPNDRPFMENGQSWMMSWALTVNLLGGDMELASQVWNPVTDFQTTVLAPDVQAGAATSAEEDCSRPGAACDSNEFVRMIPSLMVLIFYIAFMATSSMLFTSIAKEKENRTIEVLLLSVQPRQLLAGKTIALGFSGLMQTLVWLASIYISFNLGGNTLSLPEDFSFPFVIVAWSVVFFLGGFGLYASLMAGAGAMVPKIKEAGAANFVAMAPLLLGYMVGLLAPMAGASQAALPIFLSFFPLTSPVLMVMRLADGLVPSWQVALSAVLLFATAYLAFRSVAAMFHAQNLLSGQPFSIKRYALALFGRA